MNQPDIAAYAERLGIKLAEPTSDTLRRAIQSALMPLQRADLDPEQVERRRELTDALGAVTDIATDEQPSTEIALITTDAVAAIMKAAVSQQNARDTPEERMRSGIQVAATQAKADFRNGRTLPLAGFGAVLAFVWSQRDAFGVDLTQVGSLMWTLGAVMTICMALAVYWLARRAQSVDERRLRELYSPDVQARALHRLLDRPTFSLRDFRAAIRPGHMYFGNFLSAVDLMSATDDVSVLALERFVNLGVIEPVESLSGAEYRPTAKYRAKDPLVE